MTVAGGVHGARTDRFVVLTCNVEPAQDIEGFVSSCPALGVASQGETLEEAENNIREAVSLYLAVIDEDRELEHIFAEKGLKISRLDATFEFRVPTTDGGRVFVELFPIKAPA